MFFYTAITAVTAAQLRPFGGRTEGVQAREEQPPAVLRGVLRAVADDGLEDGQARPPPLQPKTASCSTTVTASCNGRKTAAKRPQNGGKTAIKRPLESLKISGSPAAGGSAAAGARHVILSTLKFWRSAILDTPKFYVNSFFATRRRQVVAPPPALRGPVTAAGAGQSWTDVFGSGLPPGCAATS